MEDTDLDIMQAMKSRHSVRSYTDKKIDPQALDELQALTAQCNKESGLNIQLITDEPEAFSGMMAHYGKFSGVKNYIALVGRKSPDLQEKAGYYGEKLVLRAQHLGLNTCWVAMTYSKGKSKHKINKGEKLVCVISLGYGSTQGEGHAKTKTVEQVSSVHGDMPDWFLRGVECALLAPTAMHQQKFEFILTPEGKVSARATGGFYSKIDLGIVKYHFEIGAGNFSWA